MEEIISINSEKLISVVLKRGDGTKENPVRQVKQYWKLNGDKCLFEIDPFIDCCKSV